jgi:DNA-binding CsgD family transcriptional regulator
MATTDPARILDCLAASYRLDLDPAAYVRNMVEHAAPLLDRGLGVMAYTYEVAGGAPPVIDHLALSERFDPAWLPPFYAAVEASGADVGSPQRPTGFDAWRHLTCGQASTIPKMRPFLPIFAHIGGSRDAFALNALDASGRGLWLGAPLPTTKKEPVERVKLFTRLAAHLTSGFRLRRNAGASKPRPAAILSARGKMLHAENDDGVVAAREELRDAALAFEEARTKRMRADVDRATERWRPLVVSRWSLLDDFDSDGKRFVVAVENSPPTRPPRKDLSEREHEVLTQAHMGHTTKVIAYELGLSHSTVRVLLHRAARKLGASTQKEAIARFDALVKKHEHKEPESD